MSTDSYHVPYNMDLHIRRFSNKPKISDLDFDLKMGIYDLLGITGEDDSYGDLRIFDEEEDLILVHYLNLYPATYHVRGTVFDISNPSSPFIIASSFAYTEDMTPSEISQVENFELTEDMYIAKATEGTAIRIFCTDSGKWFTTTHKKLRGFNSKWCGPTFGEIFESVWGSQEEFPFSSYLDSSLCHIFLLASPENRLVCSISSSSLTLVGQFERCENRRMALSPNILMLEPHENVSFPVVEGFDSVDDLVSKAEQLKWQEHTGILIGVENEGLMKCFKLVPHGYAERRVIRGNEPNFTLRYLQLKYDGDEDCSANMRELFPEKEELFASIEEGLKSLPEHLKNLYIQRYRQSGYIRMPGEEYYIIDSVYNNYDGKLGLTRNIRRQLSKSNARQLNAMLKHMSKPDQYYIYGDPQV